MTWRAVATAAALSAVLAGCGLMGVEGDSLDQILETGGGVAGWLGIPGAATALMVARRLRRVEREPSRAQGEVNVVHAQLTAEQQRSTELALRVTRLERIQMEQCQAMAAMVTELVRQQQGGYPPAPQPPRRSD